MAKVPGTYSFGPKENLTMEELVRYLEQMYSQLAVAINRKPDVYYRNTDGLSTDSKLAIGDININSSTQNVEVLTQFVNSNTVSWTQVS